jgi:hypothetical protein
MPNGLKGEQIMGTFFQFLHTYGIESGLFAIILFCFFFFRPLEVRVKRIEKNDLKHIYGHLNAIGNAVHAMLIKLELKDEAQTLHERLTE